MILKNNPGIRIGPGLYIYIQEKESNQKKKTPKLTGNDKT